MNIPGVYVEIKGDTSQLSKDMKEARKIVSTQAKGMSDALNNSLGAKQISSGVNSLVNNLGKLSRASKVTQTDLSKIGADLGDLRKITGLTDKEFEKLQRQMLNTRAAKTQERALRDIAKSAGLTKKEIAALGNKMNVSGSVISKVAAVSASSTKSFSAMSIAVAGLGTAFATLGGAYATKRLVDIADKYALINSKINIVAESTEDFNRIQSELFRISQLTGTSLAENSTTFANLAIALKDTGIETETILSMFETLNKSLVVAGVATQEASSFMLQFKQALGANRLAGDEFKAMMEANTYFGLQLAKALDTDVNGLYKMKEAGLLTTQALLDAFPKMAAQISDDFGQVGKTVGRSFQELRNVIDSLINDANTASGATDGIAESVSKLATTIDENREAILSLFSGIISLAIESTGVMANMVRTIQGFSAVAAGALSLGELARMNSEELAQWLKADHVQLMLIDKQVESIERKKIDLVNTRMSQGAALTQADREQLSVLNDQIKALKEQKKVVVETGKVKKDLASAEKQVAREVKSTSTEIKKTIPHITATNSKIVHLTGNLQTLGSEMNNGSWHEFKDKFESINEVTQKSVENFESLAVVNKEVAEASTQLWKDFASDTGAIMENFIGSTLRGEFDSIEDMWDSLLDSMLDMFINFIAKAAANSLIESIFGSGSGSGSGSGFNFSSLSSMGSSAYSYFSGGSSGGSGMWSGLSSMGSGAKDWVAGLFSNSASSGGSGYMIGTGSGSFATYGAGASQIGAPASMAHVGGSVAEGGALAGSGSGAGAGSAGVGMGAMAGYAGFAAMYAYIAYRMSKHGEDPSISQSIANVGMSPGQFLSSFSTELSPISDQVHNLVPRLRDWSDALVDADTNTIALASNVRGHIGAMKLSAVQYNATTGQFQNLVVQVRSAEGQIQRLAAATGELTTAEIAEIAAKSGVAGSTATLIQKYMGLTAATEYLSQGANSAAQNISSAAQRLWTVQVGTPDAGVNSGDTGESPSVEGSYAIGTSYVPKDMLAYIHQGEAIIPASENNGSRGVQPANISINVGGAQLVGLIAEVVEGQIVAREARGFTGRVAV